MSEAQGNNTRRDPSVFLSYSSEDTPMAQLLAMRLQDAGVNVFSDDLTIPGENLVDRIQSRIRAADFVIVVVSAAALKSQWVQKEIAIATSLQELSDRSITVIPLILDNVELPEPLRDIAYLDFRGDPRMAVEALVSRLSSTVSIDFSRFNGREFENLIGDLLEDLALRVERNVRMHGMEFDFQAHFETVDPFGAPAVEDWLVEAMHYNSNRLSVSVIAHFMNRTRAIQSSATHFALITSSQITSAAREILHGSSIRVIEGVELKRILLTQPRIVRRHFGTRPL
ncbi:MAG: TIR domain-containing protein [Pseudomonadota bacterium]